MKLPTFLLFCSLAVLCSCTPVYHVKSVSEGCPDDVDLSSCKTLAEYVSNSDQFFWSSGTFIFACGTHYLPGVLEVNASGIHLSFVGSENFANGSLCKVIPNIYYMHCGSGFKFTNTASVHMENLEIAVREANEILFPPTPVAITGALCFERVHTLTLDNVTVLHIKGYGISTHSSGEISITGSSFESNGAQASLGGNARFFYDECPAISTLLIHSSRFTEGKGSASVATGIAVISQCPRVSVTLERCTIANNSGGNVYILFNSSLVHRWSVTMSNSKVVGGYAQEGAGLLVQSLFPHTLDCIESECFCNVHNNIKLDATCIFHTEGVHAEAICSLGTVEIVGTTFEGNSIETGTGNGAAVKIQRETCPSFLKHLCPSVKVSLSQSNFSNNNAFQGEGEMKSAVELVNIEIVQVTKCSFASNLGSAIFLHNANLVLSGEILFEDNQAENGAGIYVGTFSYIFIKNDTSVLFRDNKVKGKGGALFVQNSGFGVPNPCFFQPTSTVVSQLESENNMEVMFFNNLATIAGDDVYGGEIDQCLLFGTFVSTQDNYSMSSAVFNSIFHISSENSGHSVSSDPCQIFICEGSNSHFTSHASISVIPGRKINISVQALGQRNGTTPAVITAKLIPGYQHQARMHAAPEIFTSGTNQCTNYTITFEVDSIVNTPTIELAFTTKDEGFYSYKQAAHLEIDFQSCPWGFTSQNGSCDCADFLAEFGFQCDIQTSTVWKKPGKWVGCVGGKNGSCQGNETLYFTNMCGFEGFCDAYLSRVSGEDIDAQCIDGRTGVSCTLCVENYSLVLGTNRCLPCTNKYIGLISVYLLTGVLLIAALTVFNVTITEGYLYGIIFYANLIHINWSFFFKNFNNWDVARVFVAWLSADLGIEVCLYRGLTAYQKIWLQIGYMFYIWSLQIAIILLCRRYVRCTRIFGRNINKVLSTLIFLFFTKTIRVVQAVLANVHLHSSDTDNPQTVVWMLDGTIPFFSVKHLPLFIIAVVLGVLAIMLAFFLTFVQILIPLSNCRCCKWITRLYPIFETFTGPCNTNYLFWPGLLLFVRIILLIINSFHDRDAGDSTKLTVAGIFTFLLTILCYLSPKGVYKKWTLNLLELFLLLNMSVLLIVTSFKTLHQDTNVRLKLINICIGLAFSAFITFHVVNQQTRIKKLFRRGLHCIKKAVSVRNQWNGAGYDVVTHSEVAVSFQEDDEHIALVRKAQALLPVIRYDAPREPLIESAAATE